MFAEQFQTGIARATITPPLPVVLAGHKFPRIAHRVADDLHARAVAFQRGDSRAALISVDLLWLDRHQCNAIRRAVEAETGIPAKNIMVACTHTHSGPDTLDWYDYVPLIDQQWVTTLLGRIAATACEAVQEIQPASVALHQCQLAIGINRRVEVNGLIERLPNARGPCDHTLSIMALRSAQHDLVALCLHHATHPVVLGANTTAVSGDWCGRSCVELEKRTGAVCLYLNGASGDVNPAVGVGQPYSAVEQIAFRVSELALKSLEQSPHAFSSDPIVRSLSHTLHLGSHQHPYLTRAQQRREDATGKIHSEVQALQLGPVTLVGLPGEALVETGRTITKDHKGTLVINGVNDYVGYLPLPHIIREGGYEARARMLEERGILECVHVATKMAESLATYSS